MNDTPTAVPVYGAIIVKTLEDLMDAITSIVTIGMSGDQRSAIRHLSFTRFWAERLAALADREPNGIPIGVLLRIDARAVARELGPAWGLSSEADLRRAIELLQQHARAFAREAPQSRATNPMSERAASRRTAPKRDMIRRSGPTPNRSH